MCTLGCACREAICPAETFRGAETLQKIRSSLPSVSQVRSRCRGRRRCVAAAGKQPPLDPHKILQVPRGASRAEIRAAYYSRIRALHPDVNPLRDTTAATVELNLAWGLLNQVQLLMLTLP